MNTINLHQYGKPHPVNDEIRYFTKLEDGKEIAEKCGLKDAVLAGEVDIILKSSQERGYRSREATVTESFIKGFFGDTAREVGIQLFRSRVSVNGVKLSGGHYGLYVWHTVKKYLMDEEKRLVKAAKAKARAEGNTTWSETSQFLIPDIGTVIKLESNWQFRLYSERRNDIILRLIGKEYAGYQDRNKHHDVTILAGAELSVDRVYVRKGASDYSSITFHLRKNGVLWFDGKEIKAKGRFWAKLSDVNQMKVRIDMETLAGN